MNVQCILSLYCWCLLEFYVAALYIATPNVAKEISLLNKRNHDIHSKSKQDSLLSDKLIAESYLDTVKELYPPGFSYSLGVPMGLYRAVETNLYPPMKQNAKSRDFESHSSNKVNNFPFKLSDILSATKLFENNNTLSSIINKNLPQCICKPLGLLNSSGLAQCCCSKDMQQKCEGVDLSYLLPIPGDTTTAKTFTSAKNRENCKNATALPLKHSTECGKYLTTYSDVGSLQNSRGSRKVEEGTLDALRRFHLAHGMFAPNEEDLEQAVEKAKVQLSKVKNRLPEWMKHFKHEDGLNKVLKDSTFDKVKTIKDGSELYKLLPQFKIEKVMNEGNGALKPQYEPIIHGATSSLLYQNAAAIKKQLETIRQYDILLANIRAQAQLRLIELADIEAKHHLEEVRCKKEREHGLEELNNMEEVLQQEIKLARNLPGSSGSDDTVDIKLNNSNFSNIDMVNFDHPQNAEIIQDAVSRNSKLLEELNALLHESEGYGTNPLVRLDHRNMVEDKSVKKLTFLEKALGRVVRNNQKVGNTKLGTSKITNNTIRSKRKCAIIPNIRPVKDETNSTAANDYDKAFRNLQNDLMELKDHIISHSKYTSDVQDNNVLVQIKVSVDVANGTDTNHTVKRELATPSGNITMGKNKIHFKIQNLKSK